MDRKSKIFFLVLALLIIGSVAVTYWRIMIEKDYVIEAQADCDPAADKCFIWECDPQATEESEKCTSDPEEDVWYYQIVRRKAANIPLCNPDEDENCDPWTCGENEKGCSVTFCDDENKEEQGAECNDPEEYLKNNPSEEEEDSSLDEAECEEGDESCSEAEVTGEDEECADNEEGVCPAEEDESGTETEEKTDQAAFPI